MPLSQITSKFQNYAYNDNKIISQYLVDLKNNNQLDSNNLEIQAYLLPEILVLLKKAVLNRFSTDLLFQKNYWSWGFVTLYYSNFYLAQALNRLKGNFFLRFNGIKNIQLDSIDNQYKLITTNSSNTHTKELTKLRENYTFLITNDNYRIAIPDDYQVRPFFNESKVRNDINYTLYYYKEFDNKFCENINIFQCREDYSTYNLTFDEFKLLQINNSRFDLIFELLDSIKKDNEVFEMKFDSFLNTLSDNMIFKYDNQYLKYIENFFRENKFHISSEIVHNQFKGYL